MMKLFIVAFILLIIMSFSGRIENVPEHFKHVDQVIWVVGDLNTVIENWKDLGFQQTEFLGIVTVICQNNKKFDVKVAVANLGGAQITWIEPKTGGSVFSDFHNSYGDGAMSLVHQLNSENALRDEVNRLSDVGVKVLDKLTFSTSKGKFELTLMDTQNEGKYILGYTTVETSDKIHAGLTSVNLHNLKLNQYAFAINDSKDISQYWAKIGFPEFQINYPALGETKYHGKIVEHELIQGWQRQGDIAYEWCIPVKGPIVYADHIKMHGEGIHHLAFSVNDMDKVLREYSALGYQNSMGGTWGEKGRPGSGRYEYVELEKAGGVTMELLWNYKEN